MSFNSGFDALAYPAPTSSDPVLLSQCSFAFRCDADARQATVLLVSKIDTSHGLQTFVLQYDADKLLPGTASLSKSNTLIPQPQLDKLMRHKHRSDIKTLSFSLAQPCPLWCDASPTTTPAPGSQQSVQLLIELAKATTIHIVFDYKRVQQPYHSMLRAFGKATRDVVGCPVDVVLKDHGLRKESWNVFGPTSTVGAPPPYKGSRKRRWPSSSPSPQQSQKRVAGQNHLVQNESRSQSPPSPANSYNSDKTVPLSPAAVEARDAALHRSLPAFDFQTDAINGAVARQLSAVVHTALPTVLHELLPNALREILPTLFAGLPQPSHPNTPSSSFISQSSQSFPPPLWRTGFPPPPPRPRLSAFARIFLPHLRTHLLAEFQDHQTAALSQFADQLESLGELAEVDRGNATAGLEEEVEEFRLEMNVVRDDALRDVENEFNEVLKKSQQVGDDVLEELAEQICCKQMDFEEAASGVLAVLVNKAVRNEIQRCRRQRRAPSKGVRRRLGRTRARSLLGRKRADSEWVG